MAEPEPHRRIADLVDVYYSPLYRYAFRLCGSAADADDLTQETFCQAQAGEQQLRDWSRVRGWMFKILRNAYLRKVRDEKRISQIALDDWEDAVDDVAPDTLDIDPQLMQDALQQALQQLSEEYRTPIILFYFEDFSYREIAEQMEVPMGTIMSRLARAKAFLRNRILGNVTAVGAGRRRTDGL